MTNPILPNTNVVPTAELPFPEEVTHDENPLETAHPEQPLNLHQRIAKVMEAVGYIQKDVNVAFGKTKYNAISETKVTSQIRPFLIKYGLTFLPISQQVGRRGDVTTIEITYRVTNIDNPEEFIDIVAAGEGADTQDKGAGKAQTYAYKYALLRAFAIATGDDPDLISTDELDHNQTQNLSKHKQLVDQFNNLFVAATQKGHPPVNISQTLTQTLGFVFNSPEELSTQQLNKLIGILSRY